MPASGSTIGVMRGQRARWHRAGTAAASTGGSVPRPARAAPPLPTLRSRRDATQGGLVAPSRPARQIATSGRVPLRDAAPPGDARPAPRARRRPGARRRPRARLALAEVRAPTGGLVVRAGVGPFIYPARGRLAMLVGSSQIVHHGGHDRGGADPRLAARRPHPREQHRRPRARARGRARARARSWTACPSPSRPNTLVPLGEPQLRRRAAAGRRRPTPTARASASSGCACTSARRSPGSPPAASCGSASRPRRARRPRAPCARPTRSRGG